MPLGAVRGTLAEMRATVGMFVAAAKSIVLGAAAFVCSEFCVRRVWHVLVCSPSLLMKIAKESILTFIEVVMLEDVARKG